MDRVLFLFDIHLSFLKFLFRLIPYYKKNAKREEDFELAQNDELRISKLQSSTTLTNEKKVQLKPEIQKIYDDLGVKENVRMKNCVIIQTVDISTQGSVNDLLMELFILIDALKRGSANSITVVLPIFPYQRQDRKDYSRAPISSKVISQFLEVQGISRVICFDLHAGQIQGFFHNIPVDNLYPDNLFMEYLKEESKYIHGVLNKGKFIYWLLEGGVIFSTLGMSGTYKTEDNKYARSAH